MKGAETVALLEGLTLVATALRRHSRTGWSATTRALKQDAAFCVFLGLSVAGFAKHALAEHDALSRERRWWKRQGTSLVTPRLPNHVPPKKPRRASHNSKQFWNELRWLIGVAVPSPTSKGGQLLAAQFVLLVMRTMITVRCTKLNTYFLTRAISQASWTYWTKWVYSFMGWMAASTVVNSGLRYMELLIYLELRSKLTQRAHKGYLANNAFYRLAVLRHGKLGAIDQRIVSDIDSFSKEAAFLYGHSFKPVLEFLLSLHEASKELGLGRPVALFLSQILIGAALKGLSPKLSRMVALEQELEGSFRQGHARLIANAEEIAFLRGAETERALLDESLARLIGTQRWHALARVRKSVFDNITKFQGLLIGGCFVHVPFLARTSALEAERISDFRATEELMLRCGSAFSEIMLLGKSLDELAGYTTRIVELFRALKPPAASAHAPSKAAEEHPDAIVLDSVTVEAPAPEGSEPRLLVKGLSLVVPKGCHVIVTGPNGCGKTSLFRVLAGLWSPLEGCVSIPKEKTMLWLPQNPYLVIGSLRDQVTYPDRLAESDKSQDAMIAACLQRAGVGKLVDVHGGIYARADDWNDVLSGGERQRVSFARLYYHKPDYAIIDEATSAINPDEESKLYQQVLECGTTVFSIAHRHDLRKYHHLELRIVGDGSGDFETIDLHDE